MAAIRASDPGSGERSAQEASERSGHMFDPWLTSSHPAVRAIGDNLLATYDHLAPPRRRRMKARDRKNLDATLRAILANIAYALATGAEPPTVGVSLRTSRQRLTRYDRRGFSNLTAVLETVSGHAGEATFTVRKSSRKGTASAIIPSALIRETLGRFRFRPEHFAYAPGREVVCLSRTTRDYVEHHTTRELIDYTDTAETKRFRAEVERVNAMLAGADIAMAPDGGPLIATSLRYLRRHFNLPPDSPEGTRFDLGGRLFGGCWQGLPKARRHAIRINGEPVADLDFASMFLRLAYLHAGTAPPEGDLYGPVAGLSEPRWRAGVKKVALAMLFRSTPLARLPRDLEGMLPLGLSGAQVRTAILAAHPDLACVFEAGLGLRLMFVESRILVAALLTLADQGVPALPMHDGVMVAQSKADLAATAMQDAAEAVTGFRLPITRKSLGELRPT